MGTWGVEIWGHVGTLLTSHLEILGPKTPMSKDLGTSSDIKRHQ